MQAREGCIRVLASSLIVWAASAPPTRAFVPHHASAPASLFSGPTAKFTVSVVKSDVMARRKTVQKPLLHMKTGPTKVMSRKKLSRAKPARVRKRDAIFNFLLGLFRKPLTATMPDASLERCSSCFFPTEFHKVPLLGVRDYNYDTKVLTFGLPAGVSLNLPVSASLQVQGYDAQGNEAVRPYTPISSNEVAGSFELLVKMYEKGVVSRWLGELRPGALVGFKLEARDIRAQYPFQGKTKINMICGGTGVTPMYQILQAIADEDEIEVVLLCGNRGKNDMLLREEIDELADSMTTWDSLDYFTRKGGVQAASRRLTAVHVLGDRPDMPREGIYAIPNWDGEVGWIDKERVLKYCFPPAPDVLTFVCGVPGLYRTMCGARADPMVAEDSVLAELGYSSDMVCKL